MVDREGPSELVQRLHTMRAKHGLNMQQFALKCGLPKSTMESYMRLENARRPGIDALMMIADGLDVSIDWLVGRSEASFSPKLSQKDYAMACFSTVTRLLNWVEERERVEGKPLFEDSGLSKDAVPEIAAKAMLNFLEAMNDYDASDDTTRELRAQFFDNLDELLKS